MFGKFVCSFSLVLMVPLSLSSIPSSSAPKPLALAFLPKAQMHLSKGIIEVKIESVITDKDQEIVLYCGGGSRSALVADNLQKMGYNKVYSLVGGFRGWSAAKEA